MGENSNGKPEDFDETEDVAPFEKVGDGLIKYFCHEYHVKLDKYPSYRLSLFLQLHAM